MRTVWGDHERFEKTYFADYKNYYFSGDGCRRDADGYYWITGRVDDVLNVSGHRLGTAEIESALVLHDAVAEADADQGISPDGEHQRRARHYLVPAFSEEIQEGLAKFG